MPALFATFIAVVTAFNRAAFMLAAWLIYPIVAFMLLDVVMRYAFNAPTIWSMEAALLLFGPYFLLAGPYVLHLKGHVAMDVLRQRMTPRLGRVIDLLSIPVIIIFAVILLAWSGPLALDSFRYGETSFSAWNPPIWWTKAMVPLSLMMLAAQAVVEFLRILYRDPTLGEEGAAHE